jgi:CMP/dCMP kinase
MTLETMITPPETTPWPGVIAMDGPAASGKSTVGQGVAERLGYLFFDSGILYRALTWLALRDGYPLYDGTALAALAARSQIDVLPPTRTDGRQYTVEVNGVDITWSLRRPEVDANVSEVSQHAAVREALIHQQRRIAAAGGVVMVGRDIGTVVLPDAPLKIYLDAAPEARARRRMRERAARGETADYQATLDDMRRRDRIDSSRAVAPLRPAEDAVIVDTTDMDFDAVIEHVVDLVKAGRRKKEEGRMSEVGGRG